MLKEQFQRHLTNIPSILSPEDTCTCLPMIFNLYCSKPSRIMLNKERPMLDYSVLKKPKSVLKKRRKREWQLAKVSSESLYNHYLTLQGINIFTFIIHNTDNVYLDRGLSHTCIKNILLISFESILKTSCKFIFNKWLFLPLFILFFTLIFIFCNKTSRENILS